MYIELALLAFTVDSAIAFPWVVGVPGVDSSLFGGQRRPRARATNTDTCPFNPNHPGAVPINARYPYLGAINGKKGTSKGGIQVPAPGDTAHYFEAPGPLDIRGPCPGLNAAANHHVSPASEELWLDFYEGRKLIVQWQFLSHDGIVTYNELVDMQQNVYNVGYDLANLLAIAGVGLDGDLLTGKLSLGCEADDRTSGTRGLAGKETGLNGHNKFEGDTSLSRNDYFLADGDNYKFNGTLFGMMADTCKNKFDFDGLALYRYQRYQQSRRDNGNFFFGPGSLLLYGAASFLYELFPSYGNKGTPDLAQIGSFFGASKNSAGTFEFNNQERIPDNWFNRVEAYDNGDVGNEIFSMYRAHPVQFGGNVGPGNFNAMNFSSYIVDGKLNNATAANAVCLIYQTLTAGFPTSFSNVYQIPAKGLSIVLNKLAPAYANLGCPTPLFPDPLAL